MYDFHKTKQLGKEQEFKHDLFKRGKKELLTKILRKKNEFHKSKYNGYNMGRMNFSQSK